MKKNYKSVIFLLLLFAAQFVGAQSTFPTNGMANPIPHYFAITHVNIQSKPGVLLKNATMVIKDGKIEAVGVDISIPKEAKIINGRGKYVYASFIDLFSDYGTENVSNNAPGRTQFYENNKKGAYAWNDAVKSYQDAASIFKIDDKKSKSLLASGFGASLSAIPDGIFRGTASLVLTGREHEQKMLLKPKAATQMSFNKGSSKQPYPGSMMGVIALIRQTYLDADWYKQQKEEYLINLEAINTNRNLPVIFEAENKLAILRATKIAKEFNLNFIVKGNGDEYQRIAEIKTTGTKLIIPMNFPKAYEVSNPLDALRINLADLKHWEMAAANAAQLSKANIPFAITMHGCADAKSFLQNIQKSISYGLDPDKALAALTTMPAEWLGLKQQIGSLEKGMLANFFMSTAPIFEPESNISSHYVLGKEYSIETEPTHQLNGYYTCNIPGIGKQWHIKEKDGKLSGNIIGTDTLKLTIQEMQGIYTFQFPENKQSKSQIRVNAWIQKIDSTNRQVLSLQGKIWSALGEAQEFELHLDSISSLKQKKESKSIPSIGQVIYPFCEYGNEQLPQASNLIFRGATVWTNEADSILTETDVAISNGKIVAIGKNINLANARIIDARGKFLTNGIIDEHSHIGIYRGVNECTQNNTAEVRIGDVVNSEDINIYRQLSGGVIACQQLHGSCNPVGGQSSIIKLRWGKSPEEMKISQADGFIKFALGENVKQSNWGIETDRFPQTRMGVEQVYYDAFIRAREYEAARKSNPLLTRKDLELEAMLEILNKKRFISCHSYVQSEINMLMHVGDSLGFTVNTFTHILEGYKVADKMKKHGASASTFADWWAYKFEVIDAIPQNAGILNTMGVVTAINSDDAEMGRRLNQEAAKIIKYAGISEMDAWKMVTLNPAKMLHIDKQTGSIKVGKDADLVLWSNMPLSIEAKALYTLIDGVIYFDREKDKEIRMAMELERQRLIQKMIEAKQNGEKTEQKVSELDPDYHCEDFE
jgi:imidazolonepropionase-like amidohydrolase